MGNFFSNNKCPTDGCNGGALFFGASGIAGIIYRNTFLQNEARRGGAIYTAAASIVPTQNTFDRNTANTYGGAAMLVGGQTIFAGNTFKANVANTGGGAVATQSSSVKQTGIGLTRSEGLPNVFDGNTAANGGAGYFGGVHKVRRKEGVLNQTTCGLDPSLLPFTGVVARGNKAIQSGVDGLGAVFFFESPSKCVPNGDVCPKAGCDFCTGPSHATCRGSLTASEINQGLYKNTGSSGLQMSSEILSVRARGTEMETYPGIAMAPRYTLEALDMFGQIVRDPIYGSGVCCELPAMWPAGSTRPYARAQGKQTECSSLGVIKYPSYGVYDVKVGTVLTYKATCKWRRYDIHGQSIPYIAEDLTKVTVTSCPRGHFSIKSGGGSGKILQCYKCPIGEYLIQGGATKCKKCVKGGLCRGGDDVVPLADWWQPALPGIPAGVVDGKTTAGQITAGGGRRAGNGTATASTVRLGEPFDDTTMGYLHESLYQTAGVPQRRDGPRRAFSYVQDPAYYACPIKGACPGGDTTGCAKGYTGPACGVCAPGYVKKGLLCEFCGDGPQSDPTVVAVMIILALLCIGACMATVASMRQNIIDEQIQAVFELFDEDN